ncbi:hypothetical protein GCM10017691_16510 [Pseudonocardia petroleophila]|uniref:Uncharacterized protein n=1 Tax=Pseudonocardia petroleophila TaxID=37331 RepID=A0A7G7MHM0_9PSEU|nr:hypothetical protein [Pseudonocardia petroleophila]QNG52281.1 hypothetical protein H6H00_30305 [Pseudonocardia petroleophila]
MTPVAVLVLVVGVLVVLAIAGTAFALDARRRRTAHRPAAPPHPAPEHPAPERPTPPARQVEPIDSARAQEDPPTVMTRGDDGPTVAIPRPADPEDPGRP